MNMHTWWHMNVKKFVGIFLKRLRPRVMPRNMSDCYSDLPAVSFLRLTPSEVPEGTQRLSTTFSLAQNGSTIIFATFAQQLPYVAHVMHTFSGLPLGHALPAFFSPVSFTPFFTVRRHLDGSRSEPDLV